MGRAEGAGIAGLRILREIRQVYCPCGLGAINGYSKTINLPFSFSFAVAEVTTSESLGKAQEGAHDNVWACSSLRVALSR
jgi:hypothetical protein